MEAIDMLFKLWQSAADMREQQYGREVVLAVEPRRQPRVTESGHTTLRRPVRAQFAALCDAE